ncbi:MAG: hypothetical protein MN733_19130 [Nitrososphaera sp.]|nr:hypothetical protein [Nitrososphaera sp.]
MAISRYIAASLVALSFVSGVQLTAYAQESESSMIKPLSGGSLDIMLEPISSTTSNVTFKVTFLNPNSTTVHQHQDYDFIIKQGDREIFSAARQVNQVIIHNVEGTITVPYTFQANGEYVVEVRVLGLGFPPLPITPESAEFPFPVTPEFPAGMAGVMAAVIGGTILIRRKVKLL